MLFTLQRYEFFSKSQLPWIRSELQKDVVYPTKVRIFQQITTDFLLPEYNIGCCLPYKGTNFSANHNTLLQHVHALEMLFTLQRYEFFSKSQQRLEQPVTGKRCCLPYKGTNFSANHNALCDVPRTALDVVYPTKVRIFQQITTNFCNYRLLY